MSQLMYRHPQADEMDNLYTTKRQLERMVQTIINDAAREKISEALKETNHQIRKIKNGY